MQKFKATQIKGNFEKRNFFEGWFQKIYSSKHNISFVIIYGYSTGNPKDSFGFIQLLIPDKSIEIIYFSKNEIAYDSQHHVVQMGTNILSTKKIKINFKDICIDLNLSDNQPISSYKNSMGYSYYIPLLPCYHSVLNKSHLISGVIKFPENTYLLNNALGYKEKNWGTSFPENYFWMHAVDPNNPTISILFSQAEIIWLGKSFIKHLGHLRINGDEFDLKNLSQFHVAYDFLNEDNKKIILKGKQIKVELSFSKSKKYVFKGPEDGKLTRDILHHSDTFIDLTIDQNGSVKRYKLVGNFELMGELRG